MSSPLLIVEDDPNDLDLTILAVRRCGYEGEIVIARTGTEALDYLFSQGKYLDKKKGRPALALLDLKLPGIDGIEIAKRMRSTPRLVSTPIVMLSGSYLDADLRRAKVLGIDRYIVKPMGLSGIKKAICEVLQESNLVPSP